MLVRTAAAGRDPAHVPHPDRFDPDRWAAADADWQFHHLSNGPQGCAGKRLALLLAGAAVVEFGGRDRLTHARPALPASGPRPEAFDWFAFAAAAG